MTITSLHDHIRRRRDEEIAELEFDIALWSATVRVIHDGWKQPAFRAAFERCTSSQIHSIIAGELRRMTATEDGVSAPVTRVLEAIGAIPYAAPVPSA